jgi:hypothetical protein
MVLGGASGGWHQVGRRSCQVGGDVDSEFEFDGSRLVVCIRFGNYRASVRYLLDEMSGLCGSYLNSFCARGHASFGLGFHHNSST